MSVLKGKAPLQVPCVNSVGTYTRQFMELESAFWPEAHRDPEKMARLASAAHRRCGLDNITVPFDMLVEAEILGAPVVFHNEVRWPSIKSFRAKEVGDLNIPEDVTEMGRVPVIVEAIKKLSEYKGEVPIIATITPPFTSISSYLVDTVTFLTWIITAPEKVRSFMEAVKELYSDIVATYEEAGADIITFHEMGASTSNISPKHFETFVLPYLRRIFARTKARKILNICGSADQIIDKMVETGADAIAFDENTSIEKARQIANKRDVAIIGNVSPYNVIFKGTPDLIENTVKSVLEKGVSAVAPGCDFYLETPIDNIRAFVEATRKAGCKNRESSAPLG
jgi:MtaA/CmuA family methyltransferase